MHGMEALLCYLYDPSAIETHRRDRNGNKFLHLQGFHSIFRPSERLEARDMSSSCYVNDHLLLDSLDAISLRLLDSAALLETPSRDLMNKYSESVQYCAVPYE